MPLKPTDMEDHHIPSHIYAFMNKLMLQFAIFHQQFQQLHYLADLESAPLFDHDLSNELQYRNLCVTYYSLILSLHRSDLHIFKKCNDVIRM